MSLEVSITKRLEGFTLRSEFTAGSTAAALLGASGCGKSMTLRCIAGIVRPDEGCIVLDGRVLFDSEQGIDLPPPAAECGPAVSELRPVPQHDRGAEHPLRPEKGKRPRRPPGRLHRGAAGHAAGAAGQAAAGAAFGRTAAAHGPGPHPCGPPEDPDAGRALQCAGQLPARRGGRRGGGPCWPGSRARPCWSPTTGTKPTACAGRWW